MWRVDENNSQLKFEDDGKGEEYEVEGIRESAVYSKNSESGQLPGLHYLISWKGFPEEKNTWEPASAIQHLQRLVSTFHKQNPDKPTATSTPVETAPTTGRPKVSQGTGIISESEVDQPRPTASSNALKRIKL